MKHLLSLNYVAVIARVGSIRAAAEELAIDSSALNRRILALEEELGAPIFERLPRGVRLSSAGEILIEHARAQLSDMERVRSRIADLSGVRRGHISIAGSQAVLPFFLPREIARYRAAHPAVTFAVYRRDRTMAEAALVDHSADIALVFEPVRMTDVQTLAVAPQRVVAVMASSHPLAERASVRLHECLEHPIALPTREYAVRAILEAAATRASLRLSPAVESDSFDFLRAVAIDGRTVSFQVPIGLPDGAARGDDVVLRPLAPRDCPSGAIHMCQLKGRALSVAAAKFADQVAGTLAARFE